MERSFLYSMTKETLRKNGVLSKTAGASPRPTLSDMICVFKSLTTRRCGQSLFQTSFHDHIIRSETDYLRIWAYIDENPAKWSEDCFYTE